MPTISTVIQRISRQKPQLFKIDTSHYEWPVTALPTPRMRQMAHDSFSLIEPGFSGAPSARFSRDPNSNPFQSDVLVIGTARARRAGAAAAGGAARDGAEK
jgi:hypothetical protein